jgi:hypothetical protein
VGRIVNRRNALLGWAVWTFMRRRAKAKAKATVGTIERAPRRWLRRLGGLLAAGLAVLGILALWRKVRGGGEEEWVAPEPLDLGSKPAEPSPLTPVEPDDDIPPAA